MSFVRPVVLILESLPKVTGMSAKLVLRRGTPDDARPAFDLTMAAIGDLFARQNQRLTIDPEAFWGALEPYLTHLAACAAEWWVAVDPSDGTLVGHARSVERGGLFELSELFVKPSAQSAGVGRSLLERAFPVGRGEVRLILATNDVRALARYYAADTVARFGMATLTAAPKPSDDGASELDVRPASPQDTGVMAELERAVVGYSRDDDYPWLLAQRQGHLYSRRGRVVGFSFFSATGCGPIAALEPADQTSILLHVEQRAHEMGIDDLSFQVPTVNGIAMNHLLRRGFKIDGPLNMLMSNREFGDFDRFLAFGPPVVL
jgi:GNAT superfamily N-acetyltransferase